MPVSQGEECGKCEDGSQNAFDQWYYCEPANDGLRIAHGENHQ